MLRIRPARAEDEAPIGALLIRAFDQAYTEKMPEVRLNEERYAELRAVGRLRHVGAVLVGTLEDELIATVTLLPEGIAGSETWHPGDASLRFLAVDPRFARRATGDPHARGFAEPMMDAIEAIAREWRVPGIGLHVRRGAHGVARLYARRGYVREPQGDLDLLPLVFLEAHRLTLEAPRPSEHINHRDDRAARKP